MLVESIVHETNLYETQFIYGNQEENIPRLPLQFLSHMLVAQIRESILR